MTDALSGLDRPAVALPGDRVTHFALPAMKMTVLAVKPCEETEPRSGPHQQYGLRDPEGQPDWVCGWDLTVTDRTPANQLEVIWAALTAANPCCSCCDGNDAYRSLLAEVGALIDGRTGPKGL